jgi:hypothetical protein
MALDVNFLQDPAEDLGSPIKRLAYVHLPFDERGDLQHELDFLVPEFSEKKQTQLLVKGKKVWYALGLLFGFKHRISRRQMISRSSSFPTDLKLLTGLLLLTF